ncbi:MAG: hypothetical protein ACKORE_07205 [Bacteroidota bacterium]
MVTFFGLETDFFAGVFTGFFALGFFVTAFFAAPAFFFAVAIV